MLTFQTPRNLSEGLEFTVRVSVPNHLENPTEGSSVVCASATVNVSLLAARSSEDATLSGTVFSAAALRWSRVCKARALNATTTEEGSVP